MKETLMKENLDLSGKSLEEKTYLIGKEIFKKVKTSKTSFFDRSFWSTKLMEIGMKDEKLKTELFRFVDVLPTLQTDEQLSKHISEYFGTVEGEHSDFIKTAAQITSSGFLGKMAASAAVRVGVTQ